MKDDNKMDDGELVEMGSVSEDTKGSVWGWYDGGVGFWLA